MRDLGAIFIFLGVQLLLLFPLAAVTQDEQYARRVHAHLAIGDAGAAIEEAEKALDKFPRSLCLQECLIKALSKGGRDSEALKAWQKYEDFFVDPSRKAQLMEDLAWGVIFKGMGASIYTVKGTALLAAVMTQDSQASLLLKDVMQQSNSLLRAVAVELTVFMKDRLLQEQLLRLLKEERVWDVRSKVIAAIGKIKLQAAEPFLKMILENRLSSAEEKAAAASAIVDLREGVLPSEIMALAKSDRAGLRMLACQLAAEFNCRDSLDGVIPLLRDPHPEVRIEALNLLGLLRISSYKEIPLEKLIANCLNDFDYRVAITAAWLATIQKLAISEGIFYRWIAHPDRDLRLFAASALGATGRYGAFQAYLWMKKSADPFVRANLAYSLIGQRFHAEEACEELYQFLTQERDLFMWQADSNRLFQFLAPNRKREKVDSEGALCHDQMVHLDLWQALAVMEYPKTQLALKKYLRERSWGITGAAAATLIEEGDELAASMVRELLNDKDPKVRVQTALVLAFWIKDKESLSVLQEAYPNADRVMKVKILEALGQVADPSSIPFLLKAMQDPFEIIRLVAASSLIVCLNN